MYNENYYNTAGVPAYPTCTSTVGQCPCSYPGCMDPTMQYYDPNATCDDGSCVGWVTGCMDSNAFNFSPTATQDDGSCIAKVFGCTDASAHNFDPLANTDDGSCIAKVPGCADPNAYNYNSAANRDCNDNPVGQGGGGGLQSFSGYSNAAGRRRVTIGPSGRINPNAYSYLPPMPPDARGRYGEYNPNVPITNRGSARMSEGWEVDGDIYRNYTERHHLKPQKRSRRAYQGLLPPVEYTRVPNQGRMNGDWEVDGDIYRGAAGRRRVTVGPSGRVRGTTAFDRTVDPVEFDYRDAPSHSRAISSEWTWPY